MDRDKVLEDLEIIKNTMEAAGRYSNVPGESYVSAAAAALGGSALTWYVGGRRSPDLQCFRQACCCGLA